jgi:hypothetical protein
MKYTTKIIVSAALLVSALAPVSSSVAKPYKAYTPPVKHALPYKPITPPVKNAIVRGNGAPGIALRGPTAPLIRPGIGNGVVATGGGNLVGHDGASVVSQGGGNFRR